MSATLSPELEKFKRVLLHNPAVLRLEEEKGVGELLQFYLAATESDKFLILYVFIKLGLLQGKGLIFVNDVNKCYKLKLFLQQFFINAAGTIYDYHTFTDMGLGHTLGYTELSSAYSTHLLTPHTHIRSNPLPSHLLTHHPYTF